jgi:hypothetical protein
VVPGATLLAGVQQALQHLCAFQFDPKPDIYFGCPQSILPAVEAEAEDHPVLEWLPYDCRWVLSDRGIRQTTKARKWTTCQLCHTVMAYAVAFGRLHCQAAALLGAPLLLTPLTPPCPCPRHTHHPTGTANSLRSLGRSAKPF